MDPIQSHEEGTHRAQEAAWRTRHPTGRSMEGKASHREEHGGFRESTGKVPALQGSQGPATAGQTGCYVESYLKGMEPLEWSAAC